MNDTFTRFTRTLLLLLGLFVSFTSGSLHAEGRPFITKWQGKAGVPIKIPIVGTYSITWYNEATPNEKHTGQYALVQEGQELSREPYSFTPTAEGVYVVEVAPEGVEHLVMGTKDKTWGTPEALLEVVQFGTVEWKDMSYAFSGCKNMRFADGIDKPNLESVRNAESMFQGCLVFNSPINEWDVSHIPFMPYMFWECAAFNQPLDKWRLNHDPHIGGMFAGCSSFNQPLNNWDVSKVTDMEGMFSGCTSFNQPLDNWNVSNVTHMGGMFRGCTSFNQPLDNWDVSKVTYMERMFGGCTSFNQPLDNWDVSNVTNMVEMFNGCTSFNQPLDNWDVSNVTKMRRMLYNCTSFNHSLAAWKLKRCQELGLGGSAIDTKNYSKTLASWAAQPDISTSMDLDVGGLSYVWQDPHNQLNAKGWNIMGDHYDPTYVDIQLPATLSLKQGTTAQLKAEVFVTEGGDQGVIWESSASQYVSVHPSSGEITAKAIGSAIITATCKADPSKSATCEVTVPDAGVESVHVTPEELTVSVGETKKLIAQLVTYGVGVDQAVVWSSRNPSIAKVDAWNGKVTGIAPGEAEIVATSQTDNSKQGICRVTVAGVRKVTIDQPDKLIIIKPNEVRKFTATVVAFGNVDRGVVWGKRYENQTENVQVNPQTGEVKGLFPGYYWLQAVSKADNTQKDYRGLAVEGIVDVRLDLPTRPLKVGETLTRDIWVHSYGDVSRDIVVGCSDPQILELKLVKVNEREVLEIKVLAKGEATITVESRIDPSKSNTYKVVAIEENGVQVIPERHIFGKGETLQLKAIVAGEDQRVTWSSSAPHLVEVNEQTGEATALEMGEVFITARSQADPSKYGDCNIVVRGVKSITLPSDYELPVRESKPIEASVDVSGDADDDVYWTVENESLLQITSYFDKTALLTGLRPGVTTLTAISRFDNAVSASCPVTIAGVTNIQFDKEEITIAVKEENSLEVKLTFFGNIDRRITWSTDHEGIIAFYDRGDGHCHLEGLKPGEVLLTATSAADPSMTTQCKITVSGVRDIIVKPETLTLLEGDSYTLIADVLSFGNVSQALEWISSDPQVVSIDINTGKLTALAAGVSQIQVTSRFDTNVKRVACKVTVPGIRKVTLSPEVKLMKVGETITPTLAIDAVGDVNQGVTWTSNRPAVAKVDFLSGKVTAFAPGRTTITATSKFDSRKKGACEIRVEGVTKVSLQETEEFSLAVGATRKLHASVSVEGVVAETVKWSSSAPAIAKVNEATGDVLGVSPGTATITATSTVAPDQQASVVVNILGVRSITVSPAAEQLSKGEKTTFTAHVDAIGVPTTVTWSSSAPRVAKVDPATGEVTALSTGTAIITATSTVSGEKKASATVSVAGVTGVSISPDTKTLALHETTKLNAVVTTIGSVNKGLIWQSSEPKIVKVDAVGNITALALGGAVITATSKTAPELAATCSVTVAGVRGVTLSAQTLVLQKNQKRTIAATVDVVGSLAQTVTWSSNLPAVAQVNASTGEVTALTPGKALITATSTVDATKTADCQLTVEGVKSVTVSPASRALEVGAYLSLSATVEVEGEQLGRTVTWKSDTPAVAKVNPTTGVVTALSLGKAMITATSTVDPSVKAHCVITVGGLKSVTVTPTTLSLQRLQTYKLHATVAVIGDVDQRVTWSSLDPKVATVNELSGIVTAVGAGTVKIVATCVADETKTAECTLTVEGVTGVSIEPLTVSLKPQATKLLKAHVALIGSADKRVTWTSDRPEIAEVDPTSGLVSAKVTGRALITATSIDDATKQGLCNIEVEGVVAMAIAPSAYTMKVGDDPITLTAEVDVIGALDKQVVWTSSDPNIARIGKSTGLLKAVAVGKATITATSKADPSQKVTCTVTVEGVKTVTVTPKTLTLNVGKRDHLEASVEVVGDLDEYVTWKSLDPTVVQVDAYTGNVVALAVGKTSVVATCDADATMTAECQVTVEGVKKVAIIEPSVTLQMGGKTSETLHASVEVVGNLAQSVVWSTGNAAIATIDAATGVVTAVAPGTTTITATSTADATKTATCTLTVAPATPPVVKVLSITVAPATQTLKVGETLKLTATVAPDNATEKGFTWRSEDESLATVDQDGNVTAQSAGTVQIFALSNEKESTVKGQCTLTVAPATPPVVKVSSITVAPATHTLKVGETLKLTATVAPDNATEKGFTWRSTNEAVATVSASGEVTAKAVGTTTIIAKSQEEGSNVEGKCELTVEAAIPNKPDTPNNPTVPQAVDDALLANVVVAPNPFAAVLRITNPSGLSVVYELVTLSGVVVRSGVLEGNEVVVDTADLPAGLYFARLTAQNGTQRTSRVFHY